MESQDSFQAFMKPLQLKRRSIFLPEYEEALEFQEIPYEKVWDIVRQNFKNGRYDMNQILLELIISSMVKPNLRNTQLQEYYGVLGEKSLLFRILRNNDNFLKVANQINEMYGFQEDTLSKEVNQAKN